MFGLDEDDYNSHVLADIGNGRIIKRNKRDGPYFINFVHGGKRQINGKQRSLNFDWTFMDLRIHYHSNTYTRQAILKWLNANWENSPNTLVRTITTAFVNGKVGLTWLVCTTECARHISMHILWALRLGTLVMSQCEAEDPGYRIQSFPNILWPSLECLIENKWIDPSSYSASSQKLCE